MEALRDPCHIDCQNNLSRSDSGVWHKVIERVAAPCSHLFAPFPKSERLEQASPKKTSRRHLVSKLSPTFLCHLALNCMLWPVTLVALFHALDNTVCTVSHAKISKFPVLVIFCLPAAFDASVALFAFVFVGNSTGFESIFETPCTTNFPKHYKLQPKPPVNDHLS